MSVMANIKDSDIYVLLGMGVFVVLLIKLGTSWKGLNEPRAIIVFCLALTIFTIMYLLKHPENIDIIRSHPLLTFAGIVISMIMLIRFLRRKSNDEN